MAEFILTSSPPIQEPSSRPPPPTQPLPTIHLQANAMTAVLSGVVVEVQILLRPEVPLIGDLVLNGVRISLLA